MSNYGYFYGRKPNLTDLTDTSILKKQFFSQLELAVVLSKISRIYLDQWQSIEKDDYYLGIVLGTLRSLFTFIKSKLPINSTHRDLHKSYNRSEVMATERFDKLINNISQSIKAKYQSLNGTITQKTPQTSLPSPRKGVLNRCVIDQMLNPWSGMIKTLKGNGDITNHFALKDGRSTIYQVSFQGKIAQDKSQNVSHFYQTSSATGACIPDPQLINGQSMKLKTIIDGMNETNEKLRKTISHFKSLSLGTPMARDILQDHRTNKSVML